jgi:uncharacterized membrane protein YfcA
MDEQQLLASLVIIFLAGIAQSLVGFGYALFATPLLLWCGVPLTTSIALVATCSLLQSMLGAYALKTELPWSESFKAAAGRCIGLLLGLVILKRLANLDMSQVRAVIGAILCMVVVAQLIWRPKPVQKLHWGWSGAAFLSSGTLQGVCGMGGPPLVMWSMAHDWPGKKIRGFLFSAFGLTIPVQLALLSYTFGFAVLQNVALGIACFPLVYIGSKIGMRVGNAINTDKLKVIAYGMLLATGLGAVVPALLR